MDAERIAREIGKYLTRETDIDELDGPYAVKGIFEDERERLEVGEATATGYNPLVQLLLEPVERETRSGSYLNEDGFQGCAFDLTEPEYRRIKDLVEEE